MISTGAYGSLPDGICSHPPSGFEILKTGRHDRATEQGLALDIDPNREPLNPEPNPEP